MTAAATGSRITGYSPGSRGVTVREATAFSAAILAIPAPSRPPASWSRTPAQPDPAPSGVRTVFEYSIQVIGK